MKQVYNIAEYIVLAESREAAVRQYVDRQLRLMGDDGITEFKEDDIYDALYPFFKEIADRLGSEVSSKFVGDTKIKLPRIIYKDASFSRELSFEVAPDILSDGFTLKLVFYGEDEKAKMVQTLEYIPDIDEMEFQIHDAALKISTIEAFI